MKFLRLLCLFSFCSIAFSVKSFSQNLSIKGTVIDGHTKEPISFASVYFAQTTRGHITDSAGGFSFVPGRIRDTLIISCVGYETARIPLTDSIQNTSILVQLQRGASNIGVIVKTKINKGLFLWKKIMSHKKQYNRYNLANFGYEAYNKLEVDIKKFNPEKLKRNFIFRPFSFIFNNIDSTSESEPFLPAYLLESISDYAYQKAPRRIYENIKASNTKGFKNESITRLLGVMNQNVNCYSNFITVMDKDFISPFNDNADVYYNFYVPDTQMLSGRKILHFVFKPKHPGQNTFEGDAWVFGITYQIQKLNLYLGKEANINYIDRISVFQEFIPINDSIYFLSRDKFFADFKIMGSQSLTFIGRKTTSYKNIAINSDSLTAILHKQSLEETVKTDPNSLNTSDSAWALLRHDSLSKNEKAIYATIDKLLKMPKFQRLENTLKFIGTGYKSIGNYEIGPWFNWISSNSWEGLRLRFDLGTTTGFNKHIYLHSYLAYGTKDERLKGKAEVYWITKREPLRTRLHLSYMNDIDNGINQLTDVGQDNIFSLAVRKPNTTLKFIRLKETRFEVFRELGKGFSTEWFTIHKEYTPLQNLPFISSQFDSKATPLNNFEIALRLRFAYLEQFIDGDYFRYSLGTKYPVIEITFSKGLQGILGSNYNYSRIGGSVSDYMKISPYGSFSYKAYAGKIYGALPYPFLEIHPGNDLYYYNYSSFNLMNRFEYLSDKYAGINIEHNVGSGLFRFIPLTRKLKLRQFWNAKAIWGSLSQENEILNNNGGKFFSVLDNKTYFEAGTGIDNIFKIFRLDFVWRLLPRPLPDRQSSRFGIFGSFQFQF